jgi:hypothetical protein
LFRLLAVIVAVGAAFGVWTTTASAANPHFVGDADCSFVDSDTINCEGKIAGLGNSPVFLVIYAPTGCTNPGGNNPPGQQRFVTGPFTTPNGQLTFDVDVNARDDCPGPQTPFFASGQVSIDVYECTSGAPRFNNRTGAQTNSACTLVTSATTSI